ncbi:hypothetical protein ACLK11_24245 [Escherichia coli]
MKGEKVKLKVGGALREQLQIGVNLSGPVDMDLRARRDWRKPDCRSTWK